jgi:hypothetical protein
MIVPPNPEMELAGAHGASAHAKPGGVVPEKEQVCLCGGERVARSSFPIR